jgi:glyoxylase-like metal-dependent hydrolase (beta-lactamase superfamily II)
LSVKGVLLTHGHFDHVAGAAHCKERGIPVYISKEDSKMLSSSTNLSEYAGYGRLSFSADKILREGLNEIGGIEFEVIKTPGHTLGSVCLLFGKTLFSGDTLFALSYGRYDFPTGSFSQLKNSIINKLFTLDGEIEVLPGHEGRTTINHERKYNPINEDNY